MPLGHAETGPASVVPASGPTPVSDSASVDGASATPASMAAVGPVRATGAGPCGGAGGSGFCLPKPAAGNADTQKVKGRAKTPDDTHPPSMEGLARLGTPPATLYPPASP